MPPSATQVSPVRVMIRIWPALRSASSATSPASVPLSAALEAETMLYGAELTAGSSGVPNTSSVATEMP